MTDEFNPTSTAWIVSPLKGVVLDKSEYAFGDNLSLIRVSQQLLGARSELFLSKVQFELVGKAPWYLALRIPESPSNAVDLHQAVEPLLDALMAFQIVKPIETYGLVFCGIEHWGGGMHWQSNSDRRWGMVAGPWAQLRTFDEPLLKRAQSIMNPVREIMVGSDVAMRNAIHLLQLALEHPHPYVSCLMAVTGIETALGGCDNRRDFEKKICDLLGAGTLAFPDWNSPTTPPLGYTVKELAVHLYTLRSKIAHGANLASAAQDKNSPVDLAALKDYIAESDRVRYAALLGESSIYLLGQVLQTVLRMTKNN